jgi:hypothetical protein
MIPEKLIKMMNIGGFMGATGNCTFTIVCAQVPYFRDHKPKYIGDTNIVVNRRHVSPA